MNNTIDLHAYYQRPSGGFWAVPVVGWVDGQAVVCSSEGRLQVAASIDGFLFFDVSANHPSVKVDGVVPKSDA